MSLFCYASIGFEGNLVEVEVDIRRGIPGLEIVGLPDSAVKEAKDRVRVAIRNSGFSFPRDRVLINLSPADVRKEGSGFDLPIALAIMTKAGELPEPGFDVLALGELQLSGRLRPVRGVLSAIAEGMNAGIEHFVVPDKNRREACALDYGTVLGVDSLSHAALAVTGTDLRRECASADGNGETGKKQQEHSAGDFADMRGHAAVKRALAIAAAGRHHALLFGPPGSGKTLAATRLITILPELSRKESIEITRIHSHAGLLDKNEGLIKYPPVRSPHHSATMEGMIGGGRNIRPGEISLAHGGVLILDEVPEFRRNLIQSLREPLESGRVEISRAGASCWFPADFQLILTANPCPCGNLGRDDAVCICTRFDIERYWKKLGGALLDRVDLRIPVKPVPTSQLLSSQTASSSALLEKVASARAVQDERMKRGVRGLNGRLTPPEVAEYCSLDGRTACEFEQAMRSVQLSSRACHSILKVSRTIADMEGEAHIKLPHLFEAIQLRRYGEGEFFF